jgi:hypothetical protein
LGEKRFVFLTNGFISKFSAIVNLQRLRNIVHERVRRRVKILLLPLRKFSTPYRLLRKFLSLGC